MTGDLERRIAARARRRHGLLARRELLQLGVPAHTIDRWVRVGRRTSVHRGAYLLGGAVLTTRATELAAILAVAPDAAASHRSAAYMLSLLPYPAHYTTIDVTTTSRAAGTRAGIAVHGTCSLTSAEVLVLDGVRVTSVQRTLLDLAALSGGRELERAVATAIATKRTSRARLARLAAHHPRRNGVGRLRALLAPAAAPRLTRSEAEEALLITMRGSALPDPLTNQRLGRYELDVFWPDAALAVEFDSFEFHGGPAAFEHDRLRDARLAEHGIQVVRVTWRQLAGDPDGLLARLARIRAQRLAQPSDQ